MIISFQVAMISKTFSFLKDACLPSDADSFGVSFQADLPAINKCLIVGATILIDYLYYED